MNTGSSGSLGFNTTSRQATMMMEIRDLAHLTFFRNEFVPIIVITCVGNRAAVANECGLMGLFLLCCELSKSLFSLHD